MNLSRHKALHYQAPGFPFRHPSLEAATAEAERLASEPIHAGWQFGVFHFTGITAKVEAEQAPAEVDPEQQAA
jgi:hypothetical protein